MKGSTINPHANSKARAAAFLFRFQAKLEREAAAVARAEQRRLRAITVAPWAPEAEAAATAAAEQRAAESEIESPSESESGSEEEEELAAALRAYRAGRLEELKSTVALKRAAARREARPVFGELRSITQAALLFCLYGGRGAGQSLGSCARSRRWLFFGQGKRSQSVGSCA